MRSIVLLVLALGVASAFPSRFYSGSIFSTPNCTGAVSFTVFQAVDTCTPNSGTTGVASVLYSTNSAGAVVTTQYASTDCSGAGTALNVTYTNGLCARLLGISALYTFPDNRAAYSVSTFAAANCAGSPSTVTYGVSGTCGTTSGGGSTQITVGSTLQFCTFTGSTCSGSSTSCVSLTQGQCASTGAGSAQYAFSTGSAVVPAFTFTLALIAAVSMFTKF